MARLKECNYAPQSYLSDRQLKLPATIAALKTLRKTEAPDRVFAIIEAPRILECFKQWEFYRGCLHNVVEQSVGRVRCTGAVELPGADHAVLVRHSVSGEVQLLTQPYGIDFEAVSDAVEVCKKLGLEFKIEASRSFWFPGSTILITVYKRDARQRTWDLPEV